MQTVLYKVNCIKQQLQVLVHCKISGAEPSWYSTPAQLVYLNSLVSTVSYKTRSTYKSVSTTLYSFYFKTISNIDFYLSYNFFTSTISISSKPLSSLCPSHFSQLFFKIILFQNLFNFFGYIYIICRYEILNIKSLMNFDLYNTFQDIHFSFKCSQFNASRNKRCDVASLMQFIVKKKCFRIYIF